MSDYGAMGWGTFFFSSSSSSSPSFLWQHKAVAVQSARWKIGALCRTQSSTKAGGWWLGRERSDTAVAGAYTGPLNMGPPHICSGSDAASARLPHKEGPQRILCCHFQGPLFLAEILNISLGLIRLRLFFLAIIKREARITPKTQTPPPYPPPPKTPPH